jgi:hypothetical protein
VPWYSSSPKTTATFGWLSEAIAPALWRAEGEDGEGQGRAGPAHGLGASNEATSAESSLSTEENCLRPENATTWKIQCSWV